MDVPYIWPSPSRSLFHFLAMLDQQRPTSYESEVMALPVMDYKPSISQTAVKWSTFREVFFVGVVVVAHFITQAGLGQVIAPLDIIAASLDTQNQGEKSWFVSGYSLTFGTFILISGRLCDMIGHKRMLAFGYLWFGVWASTSNLLRLLPCKA